MIIAVSGSTGTGKTTLAKKLASNLKHKYIDVNKIINEKNLSEGFDKERDCKIIDIEKLNKHLVEIIKKDKDLVIDSHLSHYLPEKYIDICIITQCELKELSKRLNKRNYKTQKIRENMDAEIFDTCLEEAKEMNHKVLIVDTTKGYDINDIIEKSQIFQFRKFANKFSLSGG